MYTITRNLINSSGMTYDSTVIITVNCSEAELLQHVLPKLIKLGEAESLKYKLIGSDNRVKYTWKSIDSKGIEEFNSLTNSIIRHAIDKFNQDVEGKNVAIKRNNKVNNRPLDQGLIKYARKEDYLDLNDLLNHKEK